MTTYEITLANTTRKDGKKSIVINFIKDRKNTSLSIRKSCFEKEWSYETSRVKKSHKSHKNINKFIERRIDIIEQILDDFDKEGISYTLSDLVDKIKNTSGQKIAVSYTNFHTMILDNLSRSEKLGTAQISKDTLNSLKRFFQKEDISFNEINYMNLSKYETYCISNGNKNSTIGIRMRTIRSTFNQAIDAGVISEKQYPFKNYKIAKLKTTNKKEVLTENEIQLLCNYIPKDDKQQFAKDMFLFSYYARGINFLDLIQLEKHNNYSGRISYIRSKTGVKVSFKINEKLKKIINRYITPKGEFYLFNIILQENPNKIYLKNITRRKLKYFVNPPLKEIMRELKINKHITFYCARHSFATTLKFNNISIETIREALGHKDIKSTMSYLSTLPDNKLDKIIEDVLF